MEQYRQLISYDEYSELQGLQKFESYQPAFVSAKSYASDIKADLDKIARTSYKLEFMTVKDYSNKLSQRNSF